MEALSSLTYKGSITEAIFEAKRQKKLFVVYISGDSTESERLKDSTWTDATVAESLSKYCILLHIRDGNSDAANFSAIYAFGERILRIVSSCIMSQPLETKSISLHRLLDPYSSVPCITAIGFNGAQVWKTEGFIAAEVLASSLEKAWLSLHIQETTASILSAALASQKSQPSTLTVSSTTPPAEGGSLNAAVASPSTISSGQPSERGSLETTASILPAALASQNSQSSTSSVSSTAPPTEQGSLDAAVASPSTNLSVQSSETESLEEALDNKVCKESVGHSESSKIANDQPALSVEGAKSLEAVEYEQSSSHVEAEGVPVHPATAKSKDLTSGVLSVSDIKESHGTSGKSAVHGSGTPGRDTKFVTSTAIEETETSEDEEVDEKKIEKTERALSTNKSSDVHLNIRLPDGVSLQEKFSVTSTLRMVKDYVNRNQTNGVNAYDLAIPYPRKVFIDQDLNKSLSELGLFNRQALIVVPRQRTTAYHKGSSSYSEQTNSATNTQSENGSNDGYFAYVRKLLSYVNPLSYFGGGASSSSSGPESQTSMWEYGPNPGLRNNPAQTDRLYRPGSSAGDPSDGTSNARNRRPTTSRLGSNIHTLKHDDDDALFGDRNAFWNGNSTQYGGDNGDRR